MKIVTTGRILIADDEETFLLDTADFLRREGYECDCARNGGEAAEMLRTGGYDLLIADITMPGNHNLELVVEVSKTAKGMPVILVTGSPTLETAIRSIHLPVVAYLVKPVDFQELMAHVRNGVYRFRMFRMLRDTKQRLLDWNHDLSRLEQWMTRINGDASAVPVDVFLALTFRNMVGCLTDLRNITEALAAQSPIQQTCHLLECPRLDTLTDAVEDTIRVLEKTKKAFKSKELGGLRRKLEEIVKSGSR
jgi:CheY-like chemotaxis protein